MAVMANGSHSVSRGRETLALWLFSGAAVAIAVGSFLAYHFSHEGLKLWTQFWNFLSSGLFHFEVAGLLVPLVVYLLTNRSKLLFEYQRRRQHREDVTALAIEKARVECTGELASSIVRLLALTARLGFADGKPPNLSRIQVQASQLAYSLNAVMARIRVYNGPLTYVTVGDDNLNMETALFEWLQIMVSSTHSVAWAMRRALVSDVQPLQDALLTIMGGVRRRTQMGVLGILYRADELLRRQATVADFQSDGQIHWRLEYMSEKLREIREIERMYPLLATVDRSKAHRFWSVCDELTSAQEEHGAAPHASMSNFVGDEEFPLLGVSTESDESRRSRFDQALDGIDLNTRLSGGLVTYSPECILALADWFLHDDKFNQLVRRSE